jgi:prolyl-tRNA synthetase
MRQSKLFPKTLKETPQDADNASTALLIRGGFIHKLMAGSYAYQFMGMRVFKKIEQIIREEMNAVGALEVYMTALQSRDLWEKAGRWSKLTGDMYQFKDTSGREMGLAMTHEEPMIDLLSDQPLSYQDFPIAVYQFKDKFRDEPRAKSGLLRAREFVMKDMYSNHTTEEDFNAFYDAAKQAYTKTFDRLHIPTYATLASGGMFTPNFSHEFQAPCEIGEDTIYVCPEKDYSINDEILSKVGDMCPNHNVKLVPERAVEVGNIFNLGTMYSEQMGVRFADADGQQKSFWTGCYGIGLGRAMGMVVELHHDERGIIWPESVAPFQIHMISLVKTDEEKSQADALYNQLVEAGAEVLYDDREQSAGAKFADADLIGIPYRVVVSAKTLAQQSVELKKRSEKEAQLLTIDEFIKRFALTGKQ